jgi:hypothetical protein
MKSNDVTRDIWNACREVINDWELEDFECDILAATEMAIALMCSQSSADASRPMRSRAGGFPDLPPHMKWPEFDGRLLPFIAQVDLAELPELSALQLPSSGILYFFCWCTNEVKDNPTRVLYYDGPTTALAASRVSAERVLPDWRGVQLYDEERTVEASTCLTISRIVAAQSAVARGHIAESEKSTLESDLIDFSGCFWDDVKLQLSGESEMTLEAGWGQMLGYGSEHECLLPFEPFDGGFRDGDRKLINLLQISSMNNMEWSDAGYLDFLIGDEELASKNFDNVTMQIMSS